MSDKQTAAMLDKKLDEKTAHTMFICGLVMVVAVLIHDGDHIMLDASTTAIYIAKAIKQKKNLTVVTNSIEIILELSDVQGWNIIASGGVSSMEDITALQNMGLYGAIIGKAYYAGTIDLKQAAADSGTQE